MITTKELVNIKELSNTEPKTKFHTFAPDVDITGEEWHNLREGIHRYTDVTAFMEMCAIAMYLNPSSMDNLPVKEAFMPVCRQNINRIKINYLFRDEIVTDTTLPFPYFFAHKFFPKDDPILSGKDEIHERTREILSQNKGLNLFYSVLLFPNIIQEVGHTDYITDALNKVKYHMERDRETKSWYLFAISASEAKILTPEFYAEHPVSEIEWKAMNEELHTHSQKRHAHTNNRDLLGFLRMAFAMQILASEKITSRNGVLKFEMAAVKEFNTVNPVPERRRF